MFVEILVRDLLRILPHDQYKNHVKTVKNSLNHKYANKVLPAVGLCICVNHISQIGDNDIQEGTASEWVTVKFKLLVFRPIVSQVMVGKVSASDQSAMLISLDFFNDVVIPAGEFPEPSFYDSDDSIWKWNYGGSGQNIFCFDQDKPIRFKIKRIHYGKDTREEFQSHSEIEEKSIMEQDAPMRIFASVKDDGLGLLEWWPSNIQEDDQDEAMSESGDVNMNSSGGDKKQLTPTQSESSGDESGIDGY